MIRLFVNAYISENDKRQSELAQAALMNTQNDHIDQIFNMHDSYKSEGGDPNDLKNYHFWLNRRPSYSDFINFANAWLDEGDICIIANSDIYFDDTIEKANGIGENEVYALSRIDVTPKGNKPFFRPDSQDAWIFRAPMVPIEANFTLGVPGCDNRIARIFADAGYKVTNPCHSINAFHLHNSNYRTYLMPENRKQRVSGSYLLLHPTTL